MEFQKVRTEGELDGNKDGKELTWMALKRWRRRNNDVETVGVTDGKFDGTKDGTIDGINDGKEEGVLDGSKE